jgi:glycosyltransferase involved in cell wall biosynthesis
MVEAMACGTPVLALPGGSVPEIVHDGVSGYICGSIEEMVKRVQHLQASPISPSGIREFVEANFSLDRMVSSYVDLYAEILSREVNNIDVSGEPQSSKPEGAVA